jgi:hypothetical protein
VRAAVAIAGAGEFVIVGSQAILGQYPDAPSVLLKSMEADLFSLRREEDADLVEGSIGEGSPFHETFGYYAHGVGPTTAILPDGWRDRLVAVRNENTGGGAGLCLEVHDLAVSKLAAGREKDLEFIEALLLHRLVRLETMKERLEATDLAPERRALCAARCKGFEKVGRD